MNYFVTGGTGFIGRFLIEKLLQREGTIYLLLREQSAHKLTDLQQRIADVGAEGRMVPIVGDLTLPALGLSAESIEALAGTMTTFSTWPPSTI